MSELLTTGARGEIAQLDWWHTGVDIPVGKGPGSRS